MLIVCPSCATPYQVEPDALSQDGRSMRCARCLNAWFATFPTLVPGMAGSDEWDVLEIGPRVSSMQSPLQSSEGMPNFATPHDIDVADLSAEIASERAEQKAKADARPAEVTRNTAADLPSLAVARIASAASKPPAAGPDAATFAARRGRPSSLRRRRWRKPGFPAAILVLLGLDACIVTWRADIVRLLPQTASLYVAVGLPVNLRGLSFENIRMSRSEHEGVGVLVLEGSIVNVTARPLEVPRLRLALHNDAKHEIYAWTMQPPRSILGAGDTLPFRSRLASPPADAREVQVRFFSRHDMVAGLN
jgi:predicted Zn finger-like uncharacterized protein